MGQRDCFTKITDLNLYCYSISVTMKLNKARKNFQDVSNKTFEIVAYNELINLICYGSINRSIGIIIFFRIMRMLDKKIDEGSGFVIQVERRLLLEKAKQHVSIDLSVQAEILKKFIHWLL